MELAEGGDLFDKIGILENRAFGLPQTNGVLDFDTRGGCWCPGGYRTFLFYTAYLWYNLFTWKRDFTSWLV